MFSILQCSVSCGDKPGTRYREVECVKVKVKPGKENVVEQQEVVDGTYCDNTDKPADTQECKVLPCTSWKHGSWGRVSTLQASILCLKFFGIFFTNNLPVLCERPNTGVYFPRFPAK